MQFQIAMPPTKRHKQFLKLRDGSLRGPARPGRAVKMRGEAILIASSFLFRFVFFVTEITFLGPMPREGREKRRESGDDINTMSFTTLLSAQIAEW